MTQTDKKNAKKPVGTIPDFAPAGIQTAEKYFATGAKATIERNRWFLVSLVLGAAHVLNGLSWNIFLPLKSIETVVVEKFDGGRMASDGTTVGNWVPDNDAISYFINKWANAVYDVNRQTIDGTLVESADIVIGSAKDQLRELRNKDNPLLSLKEDTSYSRSYEYKSINFTNKDDVALLRFKTITRGAKPRETIYLMSVSYTRVKPTTRAQIMKNPAGLFITNFNVTEESTSK
jgi:type IV secretory pathway component VirB8